MLNKKKHVFKSVVSFKKSWKAAPLLWDTVLPGDTVLQLTQAAQPVALGRILIVVHCSFLPSLFLKATCS